MANDDAGIIFEGCQMGKASRLHVKESIPPIPPLKESTTIDNYGYCFFIYVFLFMFNINRTINIEGNSM